MKHKNPNNISKQKILIEAFKLFTTKSLSEITFSDLEKATGLSRGAILYHFKTKEEIFLTIVDQFITSKKNNLPLIDADKSLWENIENFVNTKKQLQEYFTSIGIANANRAFVYMAVNAMTFSEEIIEDILRRRNKEIEYWKEILLRATERGEIEANLDIELYSQLFINIHYGYSYTCIATTNGYDIDYLLKQFHQLYLNIIT